MKHFYAKTFTRGGPTNSECQNTMASADQHRHFRPGPRATKRTGTSHSPEAINGFAHVRTSASR